MQQDRTNFLLVLLAIPALALLAILQTTVGARVALFGVKLNLVLLTVLLWTLLRGRREALIVAFTGGFWLDFLALTTLGVSSLALVLTSFVTGVGRRAVQPNQILIPVGIGLLGTTVYSGLYWLGQTAASGSLDVVVGSLGIWAIQPLFQVIALVILSPWLYANLTNAPDLSTDSVV